MEALVREIEIGSFARLHSRHLNQSSSASHLKVPRANFRRIPKTFLARVRGISNEVTGSGSFSLNYPGTAEGSLPLVTGW
jgi:hypothetical protein